MLNIEYRNNLVNVMNFHNFMVAAIHSSKLFRGETKTVGVHINDNGFSYHFGDLDVYLGQPNEVCEFKDFGLTFHRNGERVYQFDFAECSYYEARNAILNWLFHGKFEYKEVTPIPRHRVTSITDDKPYSEVDIAVHINSSLETSALYEEYVKAGWTYKQDCSGYLHTIGHHGDMPVCVSPMVHEINGLNVMYVEAESMVVDWEMIDNWIKGRCKEGVVIETNPINLVSSINSVLRAKGEK